MPTRRWIATRCQRLKHWGEQHRFDRFVIRTHRFLTIKPSIDSINTGSYLTTYSRDRDTPLCWLEDQEPKIERTSRCGGVDPPRPLIEPATADHLKITSFLRRAILINNTKQSKLTGYARHAQWLSIRDVLFVALLGTQLWKQDKRLSMILPFNWWRGGIAAMSAPATRHGYRWICV